MSMCRHSLLKHDHLFMNSGEVRNIIGGKKLGDEWIPVRKVDSNY